MSSMMSKSGRMHPLFLQVFSTAEGKKRKNIERKKIKGKKLHPLIHRVLHVGISE